LSFKALNIKLPAQAGFQLPPTSGSFGYGEGDILAHSAVANLELLNRYKEQRALESASVLSAKDARDIVVYAVGTAYFQVLASEQHYAKKVIRLASEQQRRRITPKAALLSESCKRCFASPCGTSWNYRDFRSKREQKVSCGG
jgi:hypothetical protein